MAIVTISRQFGAGGKTLAHRIARQLGYEIAHEEIVEKLAESAQVNPDGIRHYEVEDLGMPQAESGGKTPGSFVERIFASKKYMDGKRYVELLNQIIPLIAGKGNVIILGRGAQFILKDHPNTYHVLLIAGIDDRVQFMQDTYQLSLEEARNSVQKQEVRRRKLMKLFHSDDYDQPVHYDTVLNMSKMDMDLAVEVVCTLVG
jgi:cytidylate kinase